MKCLVLSNLFPPGFIGGYELGAFDVASLLVEKGHEVHVLTSDYFLDDELQIKNITVERHLECTIISHEWVKSVAAELEGHYINWRNIRRIAAKIKDFQPDCVLCFNLAGLGPVGIFQFLFACKIAVLTYFMDTMFGKVNEFAGPWTEYRRIFGSLKACHLGGIIAMSKNLMDELCLVVEELSPLNVRIVPGWVNFKKIRSIPSVRQSSDDRGVKFVFCGRVAPHKGIELITAVCEKIVRSNCLNFSIDVYGDGEIVAFSQDIRRRNLERFIRYKGVVAKDEMLNKFQGYDCMLFPTWEREPFGFTVVEAAASGCFSIMTRRIGAAEWFIDDIDCIKINRDSDSIERAMSRVLHMSDRQLYSFRASAKRNAELNLDFAKWGEVIVDECKLIAERHERPATAHIRKIEAAFLVLIDLWRSRLDRH